MRSTPLNIKLVGGFASVMLITLVVGLTGWLGVSQVKENFEEISADLLPSIVGLDRMLECQWAAHRSERILLYEREGEIIQRQHENLNKVWEEGERGWQTYASLPQTPEEAKLWAELEPKWDKWKKLHQEVIALINRGDAQSRQLAYALSYGPAREARLESYDLLKELLNLNIKIAGDSRQKAEVGSTRTTYLLLSSTLIATLVSLFLGVVVSRSINRAYSELDQIFNTASNGMRLVAKDSKVIRINDTFAALAGIRPEEAVGQTCYDMFPGDFCRTAECPLTRILNGEPRIEEYIEKRRSADGRLIPCILTATPFTDQKGNFIGILEEFKDVTKIREVEEALRRSEKWFATTLRSIGDGVIATDAQSLVTFMNPVAESMTGWRLEESLGRPVQEIFRIINEETGQPAEDPVARVIREGLVVGLANHTSLITRDGRQVPIEDSGAPIRDDREAIIGVVLVFHDISERQQAQKALAKSEEQYRLIFHQSPLGILHFDQEGVIQHCNDNLVRILGSSKKALIGFNIPLSVKDEAMRAAILSALAGKVGYYEGDYQSVTSGKIIPLRVFYSAIAAETGEFLGGVGIVEDISARKRAEEAFHNLISSSPIGIFIVQEGRFRLVNPGFLRITGYSENELLDQDAMLLVKPEFEEMVRDRAIQMLKGTNHLPYEYQFETSAKVSCEIILR